MTDANSDVKDSFKDGSLEGFSYFKKDEFESDWEKLVERKFGRVYKVKLKVLRETCALKTTTNDYRNIMEISKIGRMKFNYLISIYGICKDPPALVMEYMRKGSLDNLLSNHLLMWPKKFQMIHEMTMGMNFLHSMKPPILHLNLKPANILLDDHLHVKISDFGFIKWEFSSKTEFIEHLMARGNINYVPPETLSQNPEPPGTKYDVYSFSIIMWEILTQKRSYAGLSMTEILIRVSSGKRPGVEKIPEDKPPECEDMIGVMQQCWNQDSRSRPPFSKTVRLTEVLSEVLKIPDTFSRREIRKRLPEQPKKTADSSDDSSIQSLLVRKDFNSFKKVVRKEHVSMLFQDNNSLLHHAVAGGDRESVQMVLNLGASVNCQSVKGYTPLIVAVLHKFYEICSLLTDCGADVNLSDGDQWTALHFAVQAGDDRATRFLLDNKARADAKEKDGWTPLHLAAQNGHENIVRILLRRLDSVDVQEHQSCRTALHVASIYGHINIVKLLLNKGADIDKQDNNQSTALHLAAEEGHFRVVRLLVNSGADVNKVDEQSYSSLHFAALNGYTGICRLLLSKGIDPNSRTNKNWTAMHLAALKGHPEIILTLEEHQGSVNIQGKNGWTPLHLACHHGQEEVVTGLLTAGADPNLAEDNGWTPLHLACNSSSFPSVLQLISHKANVNAQNNSQSTPLHLAAQLSNIPIIKALLMNNAQREMQDSKGCTALTLAQQCNNSEAVELLDS
ncbi:ankyrin repeat and protein kinase domain-containing protein 1 [Danio rerio]|uniref:Ankyrin repeat and kinase domain-containing 1 n=1 Tax=Danio rerio TaxID=7955 RepID=B3DHM4_DANRE|nr:ankyrin repeat and protein kinase domain-containing protein 1 [Danio rerio]AAI62817.1 Ankyrin repeat and kinase domain containing 1 [Danio rerio]AAI63064.1 Ankyrin repeat and kinase domain containing 1 [Danio rerio]|eukprot:NP_001124137.1 ankyrin repeat and protein kinase domain-containing protein 1 [Danio rerio]